MTTANNVRVAPAVVVSAMLVLLSCGSGPEQPALSSTVSNVQDTFHGWESVTVRNAFTRIDVIPGFGGAIVGYEPVGVQLLWLNPGIKGSSAISGAVSDGRSAEIGGARVRTASPGYDFENPDRAADRTAFEVDIDSTTISTRGTVEGIEYANTCTLVPNSTVLAVTGTATNRDDSPVSRSLAHLIAIPQAPPGTFRVPLGSADGMGVVEGVPFIEPVAFENGLVTARPSLDGIAGIATVNVSDGWVAWYDDLNGIAAVFTFQPEKGKPYPLGASQAGIRVSSLNPGGGASDTESFSELSLFSPVAELAPGERMSFSSTWKTCRCSGIEAVVPVGVVVQKPVITNNVYLTARFGTFYAGTIEEFYFDREGRQTSLRKLSEVSPSAEIVLNRELIVPPKTVGVRYQLRDKAGTVLGTFAETPVGPEAQLKFE